MTTNGSDHTAANIGEALGLMKPHGNARRGQRKLRTVPGVSPRVARAISTMVDNNLSATQAAKLEGLNAAYLQSQLRVAPVAAFYRAAAQHAVSALLPSALAVLRTILTAGESENVKLKAAELVFRMAGVETNAAQAGPTGGPGYIIVLGNQQQIAVVGGQGEATTG